MPRVGLTGSVVLAIGGMLYAAFPNRVLAVLCIHAVTTVFANFSFGGDQSWL